VSSPEFESLTSQFLSVPPLIRQLGRVDYQATWQAMQDFTDQRTVDTPDELWVLEHEPVFTLGMNAEASHLLDPGAIPVIKVDRGGQVTYHGPGQLVLYPLLDLRRSGLGVRNLITTLEQSVIGCLARYAITATTRPGAPGVYVDEAKIASLGIRVRRGASYHGLSLNINMDLEPFSRINPCGYAGLAMTQVASLGGPDSVGMVADVLISEFLRRLKEKYS
jgi:lipoyl(octanoyl) transferase